MIYIIILLVVLTIIVIFGDMTEKNNQDKLFECRKCRDVFYKEEMEKDMCLWCKDAEIIIGKDNYHA